MNEDFNYLIENHLICIKYNDKLNKLKLLEKFKELILKFKNKKTKKFISLYFENNAINTTELNNIIPFY